MYQRSRDLLIGEILSLTVPWHGVSLIDFLKQFPDLPKTYFESERGAVSMAGVGIAAGLRAKGVERFSEIQLKASQLFAKIKAVNLEEYPIPSRLVGGFSFQPASTTKKFWSGFPPAAFVLPAYVVTKTEGRQWLTVNRLVPAETDEDHTLAQMKEMVSRLKLGFGQDKKNAVESGHGSEIGYLPSQEDWEEMVACGVDRIRRGDLEKVVLARVCRVKGESNFNLFQGLEKLNNEYPGCFRFWLEFNPGHVFMGATPERLVSVQDGVLSTEALAGSIRRGKTAEEDRQLSEKLINSPKDQHEHRLVVEEIRSRLQPLVQHLELPAQPGVSTTSTIQHLRTKIGGRLRNGCGILEVVEALHPTPAVGGFPRDKALQLIEELEAQDRGWYAAPVGHFDAEGNGEFAVAIRSGIASGNEAWLYSGAGIVADSHPAREWEETQIKLKPMLSALEGGDA